MSVSSVGNGVGAAPPDDLSGGPNTRVFQLIDGTTAIVRSQALRNVMHVLSRVAQHNASVLIVGETGSGKELIARAIHQFSRRCTQMFVDVNCAALPEHLVESELFGYEKGAFSGADTSKPGLFELADGGTLFLDEVGELDGKVQVKLLRVLDGAPYYRLGGHRKVSVDVRIVGATNQDMEAAVRSGKFRRDLYYRLSQFQLRVPPLRERPEDVLAIAEHVLRQYHPNSKFSVDALEALQRYSWPGNVRELKNVIFNATMQAENAAKEIRACDLPIPADASTPSAAARTALLNPDLDQAEKQIILDTLQRTGGHRGKAAEQLGVSRRTLSRKLKQYRTELENEVKGIVSLSYEQQRYFRVTADIPVTVRSGSKQTEVRSVNLSSSGIALCSQDLVNFRSVVELSFVLPSASHPITTKAKMAWLDSGGKAGFRFQEMRPEQRQELESWLVSQIAAEGWGADADATE
jgi:two-component system, NtrC family, response regulator AtoC